MRLYCAIFDTFVHNHSSILYFPSSVIITHNAWSPLSSNSLLGSISWSAMWKDIILIGNKVSLLFRLKCDCDPYNVRSGWMIIQTGQLDWKSERDGELDIGTFNDLFPAVCAVLSNEKGYKI